MSTLERIAIAMLVITISAAVRAADPEPVVPKVRALTQPRIDMELAQAQKETFAELAQADAVMALFKPPLRQQAVKDPWGALTELEKRGLDLAAASRGGLRNLPAVLSASTRFLDKPAAQAVVVPRGKQTTLDEHIDYLVKVLDEATRLREQALARLSEKDRELLFARPAALIHEFGPQLSFNERTKPRLEADRAFVTHWEQTIDQAKFMASVLTFLRLTEPEWLEDLKQAMAKAKPMMAKAPNGFTGDLLAVHETRHGLIVLGGAAKNSYDLKVPVAFLADLGGDDSYKGKIASSFDAMHPFSLVVDFAGNDTYEPGELGLATGILGGGLLLDRGGDDIYKLAPGSGGCGFAGVGILMDESGKDTYTGSRWTQGAAIAGVGLLIDMAGDDTYTSFGYALGIGGPAGVGAIIDVDGNDRYQCGHKYGSGYNSSDAPNAKPGDPNYQYDAFGMGIGLGRRTYPPSPESAAYHLAGGVGVWLDLAGDDRSESSNFAQACAYFFGIGLKLDLAGNDRHGAARYGHAAGAHYGLGLFIDYDGNDTYVSEGPTYNGGCAWDRSVFALIDAKGDDVYDLTKSSGIGRADRGGWAVFADLAGQDTYKMPSPAGVMVEKGLSILLGPEGRK